MMATPKKPLQPTDTRGWVVGMHWFGVASVPLMALLSTFIQATRAGSAAG
jgi:hypothetical protein